MKTYSLLTKPYKIQLRSFSHKMKHQLTKEDRWIEFKRGTEMWCCKVKGQDHSTGFSLMVFNHSWMTTFKLDSLALKKKWHVNEDEGGDWKSDLNVLLASYSETLHVPNFKNN